MESTYNKGKDKHFRENEESHYFDIMSCILNGISNARDTSTLSKEG